jgi:hypothetical protein
MRLLLLCSFSVFIGFGLFPTKVAAQSPTIRFESDQVPVSQRAGVVSIPLIIENSHRITSYLSVEWTTNSGTAQDRVHFGNNSPYNFSWSNYGGALNISPNQSQAVINIPIHFTASPVDLTFAVRLTGVTNVYAPGILASMGTPSAVTVTILNAAAYINSIKGQIAQVNRKIKIARKIKNPKIRKKKIAKLTTKKNRLAALITA